MYIILEVWGYLENWPNTKILRSWHNLKFEPELVLCLIMQTTITTDHYETSSELTMNYVFMNSLWVYTFKVVLEASPPGNKKNAWTAIVNPAQALPCEGALACLAPPGLYFVISSLVISWTYSMVYEVMAIMKVKTISKHKFISLIHSSWFICHCHALCYEHKRVEVYYLCEILGLIIGYSL